MNTPEKGQREMKPDIITEAEQDQLNALEAAAEAARIAGVYDPSGTEEGK